MLKALVFDLDGTLCDTVEDLGTAVNYALKEHGFPERRMSEYPHFLGNGSKVLIHKALGENKAAPEEEKAVFDTYLSYYNRHLCDKTRPFDGMKETLLQLKEEGYKLGVLTNKPESSALEMMEKIFPKTFDAVLGNSPAVPTKPDPKGMSLLLAELGVGPEETAYGGDSDVDMILAEKAKVSKKMAFAYGYRPLGELLKYDPDVIIYRPSEILDFVHKVNGEMNN